MKHLEKHNILTDSQHRFRAKRSTETKLTHILLTFLILFILTYHVA